MTLRTLLPTTLLAVLVTSCSTPMPTPEPTDTTPPSVTRFTPADGATEVALDGTFTITFSESVKQGSVVASLAQGSTTLSGTLVLAADRTSGLFTPSATLPEGATLTFSVTGYSDDAGNQGPASSVRFTTRRLAPTVTSTSPLDGAQDVAVDVTPSATFDKPMDNATLTAGAITLTDGTTPVTVTPAYTTTTRTLSLAPSAPLLEGKTYTVTLAASLKDTFGVALAMPYSWSFKTVAVAPTVSITPADGASDVSANSTIVFAFSEAMSEASLTQAVSVTVGGVAVPGASTYSASNHTLTFQPTGALPGGSMVVARVSTSATDLSGVALAAAAQSSFSVSNAPAVNATDPARNAMAVPLSAAITVQFTAPMDLSTLVVANVWVEGPTGVKVPATYTTQTSQVTMTPTAPLAESTVYTLVVDVGARNAQQVPLAAQYRSDFTTVGVPPRVSAVTPVDGATGVALNAAVRVTFDEDMNPATFVAANVRVSDGAADVAGTVTQIDARTVQFAASANWREQARYTVIVSGVTDVKGNALADDFRAAFTTEALPRITSIAPQTNEVGVPQSSALIVQFNKTLDASTLALTAVSATTASTFTLYEGATRIEGALTWEATSRTVRVVRTNVGAPVAWTAGRRYVLELDGTRVKDLTGNALGGRVVTSFVAGSSSDTVAPTVTASSPGNGDTGVSRLATLSADFSEAIDASTLNATTVQVLDGTTVIAGRIDYVPALRRVLFVPASPLPASRALTLSLSTGIKDMSGNAKAAANTVGFTTDLNAPPAVTRITPAAAATGVHVNASVRVDFSEAIDPATLDVSLANGTTAVVGTVSWDSASRTAHFVPAAALPPSTMLTVTVRATVADLEGATLGADVTSSFTTIANSANDVTPPAVSMTSPAMNATGVRVLPQIGLSFSEPLDAASVTSDHFTLQAQGGARVPFGVVYDSAAERAVLTPSIPLTHGVTYEVLVSAGVLDLAGNAVDAMAASSTLRFIVDATPPTIVTRVPSAGAIVGSAARVDLTFSEDMDPSSIDAASFSLSFGGNRVLAAVSYDSGTRTAVLQPAVALADGTQTVSLDGMRVRDLAGNTLSDMATFTVSSQQPAVVSATPCGTLVDVYALGTQGVSFTFDRAVKKAGGGALDATTLKLRLNGVDQAATVTHTAGSTTATLTPSAALLDTRTYEVQATTGVVDNATNVAMSQTYSCTFQTQRVVFKDLVDDMVTAGYTLSGGNGNAWQRVNSPDDARNSIVWRGGNASDGVNYARPCALAGATDVTVAIERSIDLTGLSEAELRFDEFHLVNSAAQDRARAVVIAGATTRELYAFTGNATGYTSGVGQGTLNLKDFVGSTVKVRFELLIKGVNLLNCNNAPAGAKGFFVDNLYVVGK